MHQVWWLQQVHQARQFLMWPHNCREAGLIELHGSSMLTVLLCPQGLCLADTGAGAVTAW